MALDDPPKFVAAVVKHLPEGWTLEPPDKPTSCLWKARHPDPAVRRFVGIVAAGTPSVDCRTSGMKIDAYRLEWKGGADGGFLPDRMLGYYVREMCNECHLSDS